MEGFSNSLLYQKSQDFGQKLFRVEELYWVHDCRVSDGFGFRVLGLELEKSNQSCLLRVTNEYAYRTFGARPSHHAPSVPRA